MVMKELLMKEMCYAEDDAAAASAFVLKVNHNPPPPVSCRI